MSKDKCVGCYNNDYNHGLGGAKECWSLASAVVTLRRRVGMNDVPPWKAKPERLPNLLPAERLHLREIGSGALMSADPTTNRAAFEAAWDRLHETLAPFRGLPNKAQEQADLDFALRAMLALYDQAAHSAAAGAPDAAVDKGADLIDRAKLKEAIRNMEWTRHISDERWNIVQLIDTQPSAAIASTPTVQRLPSPEGEG